MKNVAILAIILGLIGNAANAESAVSDAPVLALAMNSGASDRWAAPAISIKQDALANRIELNTSKVMEKVNTALDKQLEEKLAQEIEYALR